MKLFEIPIDFFEHAVVTHTIIGMSILTSLYLLMNWVIGRKFLNKIGLSLKVLIMVALVGMLSHLILDVFTYREDIITTNAHLYFWPLWNFSFHLNAFFPKSIYPNIYIIRLAIEIIYTAFIGSYIIFYQWSYKKENPFLMFNPNFWLHYLPESVEIKFYKKYAYALAISNFALLGLISLGVVAYF